MLFENAIRSALAGLTEMGGTFAAVIAATPPLLADDAMTIVFSVAIATTMLPSVFHAERDTFKRKKASRIAIGVSKPSTFPRRA